MNTTAPVYVEDWFLAKNFTQNEQYGIGNADSSEIIRETEKAVQVAWYTKYGTIKSWVPLLKNPKPLKRSKLRSKPSALPLGSALKPVANVMKNF